MASGPYEVTYPGEPRREAARERSIGEHVFIWGAWALAAAFWGMTMTIIMGILGSVMEPSPAVAGGSEVRGIAWLLIDIAGVLLMLGLAMAYASQIFIRRNHGVRSNGEAATAELYNRIERAEGEEIARRNRAERDLR